MPKFLKSVLGQCSNTIQKAFLEVLVPNRKIRRVLKGNFAKSYLKKYVKQACNPERPRLTVDDGIGKSVIWQYWEQGKDAVGDVIKVCLNSVEKHSNGRDIIFLSAKNIDGYVELPSRIYDLKRKGVITPAHFSDILRAALLLRHGGTWIDSTVMLTSAIPDFVLDSDLFVFSNVVNDDLDGLDMASYFMHATPNNAIIADTLEAMFSYWEENSFLKNYFLFLHAFTMVCAGSSANKAARSAMPFFSFHNVQRLESILARPFDEFEWESVKKCSFAHKLTHKKNILQKKGDYQKSGTFYDVLINKAL